MCPKSPGTHRETYTKVVHFLILKMKEIMCFAGYICIEPRQLKENTGNT